jgi:hypothetical protein
MIRGLSASLLIFIASGVLAGAQKDRVMGRLAPVSDFPELPAGIAQDLTNRGCRIPQVKGVSKRHNIIRGEFEKPGQRDWAVLCVSKNISIIFVYWNGAAKNPAQLAPLDETLTRSKNGYYRILRVVGEKFIRSHYAAYADVDPVITGMAPLPAVLDHDGIDDGILEKGSSVHYLENGKWLKLAGSD